MILSFVLEWKRLLVVTTIRSLSIIPIIITITITSSIKIVVNIPLPLLILKLRILIKLILLTFPFRRKILHHVKRPHSRMKIQTYRSIRVIDVRVTILY